MSRIAVTGSVAFDLIAHFSGRFADSFLPDQMDHINVSFLVDRLERRRGGTAANIAYTLALLGERPLLCAAVGTDFAEYGAQLTAAGVDIDTALRCTDLVTASCSITTDDASNQLTTFYPGAMARAAELDLAALGDIDVVVVSPDAPDAMRRHVEQAVALGHRLAFSPAQQLPALDDTTLAAGLDAAWLVVGNEYEFELIAQRIGRTVAQLSRSALVAVTRGADGSVLHRGAERVEIPAAAPLAVLDPTGAGDAYLAGLLAGVVRDLPLSVAGRIGALAATHVVEQAGPQDHGYDLAGFERRFSDAFGMPLTGLSAAV